MSVTHIRGAMERRITVVADPRELEPCIWCGASDLRIDRIETEVADGAVAACSWAVTCNWCGASGAANPSRQWARDDWNARSRLGRDGWVRWRDDGYAKHGGRS